MTRTSDFFKSRGINGPIKVIDKHHWAVSVITVGTWCLGDPPLALAIEGEDEDEDGKSMVFLYQIKRVSLESYL